MPKTGIRPYETKTKGLRWLAYYYRDSRQVLKRGFRTSRQAERWRADALVSVESPADTMLTVGEWVTEWLEGHRRRIRPSTYVRYEGSVRNWIVPHIGMVRLVELAPAHIDAMHAATGQAGRSPQTIRRNHAPLRTALQDAVRDGLIPHNPASLVRLPPLQKVEFDPFTAVEARMFLAANRGHRFYPIYHLALRSGLRLGEILALQVGRDIDLLTRTITVKETRRQRDTGPPKSRESVRRVVVDSETAEVLAESTMDKPTGALAFPMSQYAVSSSMAHSCRAAGVKRIRFHDLRHSHATHLIEAGANIRAVSSRLGHASVAFTLQVYGHVMPGMDEELAEMSETIYSIEIAGPATRDGCSRLSERQQIDRE